jgi:predicted RNase H-like HicB family nuclease
MLSRFSTLMVSQVSGATRRQLDSWARSGFLVPSGQTAHGKGSKRLYTFQDVVAAKTVVKLRGAKCPLGMIKKAIEKLRAEYPELSTSETIAGSALLTDGERVYILQDGEQAMDILSRQTVWAIPLGKLIIETSQLVEKLPEEWMEHLIVQQKAVHLRISRETDGQYVAHCREYPGVLERANTADVAIAQGKQAIHEVLTYLGQKGRQMKVSNESRAG